ncbi:MAG: choice-of-anchor J domain-containing protein [Flavobacteriia bacterium]|nr:choice-of-anchor J domain-containing protein [Flavobacteriia bacterium]MBH2023593.1 choice-of-anchor J domain-containing protein [Flavobacteriales bacterium]
MKKYSSFFKIFFIAFASLLLTACVHDDKYDDPVLQDYQCKDLTATMTIAQVKALHTNMRYVFPEGSTAVMEGYVSSTDDSGNIYKTIYIQDSPVNPTQGFVISVDAVSTYTKFPQGSKIYIELKGLALGTYGGLVQLGVEDANAVAQGVDAVSRIPEKLVPQRIFRSCTVREEIVPKVLKISEMAANQALLGALIKVEDVEFTNRVLCSTYAPDGVTVDRPIGQGWNGTAYMSTAVVRNSGFAAFANQSIPAGNGDFVGIFSKFNTTYQMYINKASDLADMKNFPRLDGIAADPCVINPASYTAKTVAEVKQLYSGSLTQINGNFLVKAKVTANDETGNLFKYIYIEDATGGIRVNINKTNLYQDSRFKVGKEIYIKLKDLYIGNVSGELQIGQPFNGNAGQIAEADVYKHFFDTNLPATPVVATERTITQLTTGDVGRWIKLKDLQFIDADLGQPYASGGVTNRTLEDCAGNKILLRTSNFATFAGAEVDGGKGDVYGILSVFNGTYQLWIPKQVHADLDDPRCDGSQPPTTIFFEGFQTSLTANFTAYDVAGPQQVWTRSNQGTGTNYYAVMNGGTSANEDWLVSSEINLTGYNGYSFSFDSDGRATTPGNPLEVYITENFSGNPSTTTWTKIDAPIDTALGGFAFFSSGKININSYANKKIRIAFKYTSTPTASTTWEVDNLKVSGSK